MNLSESERRTLELLLEIAAISMSKHRIGGTDAAVFAGVIGAEHQRFDLSSAVRSTHYSITIEFLTARTSFGKPEQMTMMLFMLSKDANGTVDCFAEARAHPGGKTRELVRETMTGRRIHTAKAVCHADDPAPYLVGKYMGMLDTVSAAMDAVWNTVP